ncbi:MAG: cysteine--tRNA ligase [Phycisphaerales bacterium]|jgi:cysteinyl-tRNA synthetase|nr:cysteine--tRNA ligase [Phycisphaerales bacterium]MBT7171888.1 cysteine--tRNA ligase [Phycisphaerales bacterium]
MPLKLYNTMTRSVDEFTPRDSKTVTMYTCGPTVYNFAHIGNLRTYVFEDVLVRALAMAGFDVNRVMNVTDVGHLTDDADSGEDKMEKGAAREGKTVWEIAQYYLDAFEADMEHLHILPPTVWCKATDEIDTQIDQVKILEDKGFTYTTSDAVYFDTSKLPDYGKLSRQNLDELEAGKRVEMGEKKNPTDFALWKCSPEGTQRLMEWPSPWGVGFPGWHIECSSMAIKYLGEHLDIHCGGIDHIQVHHSNEIAQAEAALGHEWCNWWMHGEFLLAGGKMSKSSGEFLTLALLIEKGYDPIAYRYFLLGAHYRQQLQFSFEGLDAAASAIKNLTRIVEPLRAKATGAEQPIQAAMASYIEAVNDDLNMPRALAAMWNATKLDAPAGEIYATLLEMDKVLALGIATMAEDTSDLDPAAIDALIVDRTTAKAEKNWGRADEIRDELMAMGIEIMDSAEGTTWRKA